jgi:pilus assembly protein CpaB
MNKNIIIVLSGALAVALVVALLVQVSLGGKKQEAVKVAKVEILVADKDLALGQPLKEGDTRWQEWPQASVFPGAVVRQNNMEPAKALEGRLARSISKGEPVLNNAILGEAKGNFVAASLEPGMRAVAIEIKAASSVGGFISPGDRVDVVLTYKISFDAGDDDDPRVKEMVQRNIKKMASETILQNLKVLAVDQMAKPAEDDKVKVGKTVTLAMTAEDAEKISLADGMGDLVLVLRGVGDEKVVEKSWTTVTDARLVSVDDEIFTEYRKIKKGAGINAESMRIYNGANVSTLPAQ